MAARALATASISFGLVSIPIKLFTTIKWDQQIRFNQLDADGNRVKQQYVSARTGAVVERSEMKKGYEFAKGQYVVFDKDELAALEARTSYAIEIKEFIPLDAIDPIYFDKAYYLGPDKGGAKAYRLLIQAMQQTERVAIAKYAARGKDYLVLLRPYQNQLMMAQLHYAAQVKSIDEIPIEEAPVDDSEVKLAVQLISQVASDEFKPEQYEDEVRARILAQIERKVAGEEITAIEDDEHESRIVDLMAALKASLDEGKKPAKRAKTTATKQTRTATKRKAS